MEALAKKYEGLQEILRGMKRIAVAYSSGVDSTLLLKAAKETLGVENVVAVTISSCLFPHRELTEAIEFCKKEGIKQIICDIDELEIEGFSQNPPNRCYLCKHGLFQHVLDVAKQENMYEVVEGSNLDDEGDYRPGMQAIKELGIKSPLRQAKLSKAEIRALSKELDLPTWKKASFACLASRFVYGETITPEKLQMVDQAEQMLLDMGLEQFRVRIHGTMARIEILPEDFQQILEKRQEIITRFKEIGFSYTTLDLQGYRTGSMNEVLNVR